MDNPCKDCEKRYPGCHDVCEPYKEAMVKFYERKEKINAQKHKNREANSYWRDQHDRIEKRQHKRRG